VLRPVCRYRKRGVCSDLKTQLGLVLCLHIREGLQRDPIEHTRFSKPLAGEHWWHHPDAPHVLEPGSPSDTHPYPVELDLPPWTVERDIDLCNWLFGFGDG
jgi:hypothetical protein